MTSINEEEWALKQLLAQTNKEILETQEECNLLAELILRKKLKNIAEYRAAIVPITGRGGRNKSNLDSKDTKDAKDKKKRDRKSDGGTGGSAKKARKSSEKADENEIIQEEYNSKNTDENIVS